MWSKNYETGIADIDEQHKELFRQIDILLDRSQEHRMKETLDFLGEYVVKHFKDEERSQARSNYPKAAEHRGYHAAFVLEYGKLKDKFDREGSSLAMNQAINKSVFGWLRNHIMVHDKEFAGYYTKLGNR